MKPCGNELVEPEVAVAHRFPEERTSYSARDVALYALGVGAGPGDLRFVYEGHPDFAPLPTFAVVPALNVVMQELSSGANPGLHFGLDRLLHAVQLTELKRPWPSEARLRHRVAVTAVWDRLKYAAVVTQVRTFDESDAELAVNEFTMTVRGAGGFGGEPGPSAEVNLPPARAPDAVAEQHLRDDQALLYRLSGDLNPLHVDPEFAQAFGLARPILHGLCTYGFAARHVLHAFAGDDPRALRSIRVKFAAPVFPGETLLTEMWREREGRVIFRCKAKERDRVVLAHAAVELGKAQDGR